MALTSLPESKSVDMGIDFFQKMIGYLMHGTYIRFSGDSFSLSSPFLLAPVVSTVLVVSAISTVFFLVSVTSVKIAKTDTSFLTLFSDFRDTCLSNIPFYGRGNYKREITCTKLGYVLLQGCSM